MINNSGDNKVRVRVKGRRKSARFVYRKRAHGGWFPRIKNSDDKKVRVGWYGRRKRARQSWEREREIPHGFLWMSYDLGFR